MNRIYLDHAATTPPYAEVVEAMQPWLTHGFGNPSSLYREGREARQAIDRAREILSCAIGSEFGEVIFTSSGTESANLAVLGTALSAYGGARNEIILSAAEHHCVLGQADVLQRLGFKVRRAPVDRYARIDLDWLEDALSASVLLVSAMHLNNEIGTIERVGEVMNLCERHGVLFHCDAVQSFCTLPVLASMAHMISVSAHKLGGAKGAGALYLRAGLKPTPILSGGGQEREMRAGTENVAAIVGFGRAIELLLKDKLNWLAAAPARDAFADKVRRAGAILTVDPSVESGPSHCHLRFEGVSAESMLVRLDRRGVSASSGAACSSGSIEPSHVMLACGYSEDEAREGLRFSFGRATSVAEALAAADIVIEAKTAILGAACR